MREKRLDEGFDDQFAKGKLYGVAAVFFGGKQMSTGHLHLDGFESPSEAKIKTPSLWMVFLFLQRMRDSNPRKRSQSPVCYRYTNPLYAEQYLLYPLFWKSQEIFSNIPQKFAVKPPGWCLPGRQGEPSRDPRRYPDSCRRSGCRCGGCSPARWRWEPPQCWCSHGPGRACQDHPH